MTRTNLELIEEHNAQCPTCLAKMGSAEREDLIKRMSALHGHYAEPEQPPIDPKIAIHSGLLPGFTNSFSDELANFYTEYLPSENPKEWLDANKMHLDSVSRALVQLTGNHDIEKAGFVRPMMYQRLIMYTFAHLAICFPEDDNTLMSRFKANLEEWNSWDRVTALENHQTMKDYVLHLYRHHLQDDSDLHPETQLKRLLAISDTELCAYLASIIADNDSYKEFLARRGPAAQALLNLLHKRMNFGIDSSHKTRHVKALVRLSRASSLYPECLVLKGVKLDGEAVAAGGFGDVYKGQIKDQKIAVKVLRVYQKMDMVQLLKGFSSEAVIWGQLKHENVLPFYGIYHLDQNTARLCLACPWMEFGNAVHYLRNIAPNTDCVTLSLDIAQGLEYLHNERIVHGDMKALNILISGSRRACIADFGLSTAIDSQRLSYMTTNKSSGTMRWQAPELFSGTDGPTTATDIYSFGLVCYEMFSGDYPFLDIRMDIQVMIQVQNGRRPERPSSDVSRTRGLNDGMWNIMASCWAQTASERLSAAQVVGRLLALPNRDVDDRPRDKFLALASQVLSREIDHPFSCLELYTPIPPTAMAQPPISTRGIPYQYEMVEQTSTGYSVRNFTTEHIEFEMTSTITTKNNEQEEIISWSHYYVS